MKHLKLMILAADPKSALDAQRAGIDRIFYDLEWIGKNERQHGRNTVKSNNSIEDILAVREVLTESELLVRTNPIHAYSKVEIDKAIAYGADVVQEFTLFVEEFERSAASLPYPDILVGDEGEPGFEHGGVRVVETYDAAVFDKFAERHVDSVFRQGEVAHGQFVSACFNGGDTSVVRFQCFLFLGENVAGG